MRTALLFHGDLDGLYSAILYKKNFPDRQLNRVQSIEYGIDHSSLIPQFDSFVILDFGENLGGVKTELLVDHHLHTKPIGAQKEIVGESDSSVSLMLRNGFKADTLAAEDVQCIDTVDSANFKWSDYFDKADLLLPEPKNLLSKYVILNQLLRKNRKHGLAEKLWFEGSFNVDVNLYKIENDQGPKTVKYNTFMENKTRLLSKLNDDQKRYIKYFSDVPVLFTKEFTQEDWKGYDLLLFGYLVHKSPFMVIIFDMAGRINVQIVRNVFCKIVKRPISDILGNLIEDPRGHENILNFTYKNMDEAIANLDAMISKLSAEL